MECPRRPNRSDVHLSADEEAKLDKQTRDYFDGIAPQRHTKPQRSEHSTQYVDTHSINGTIPEYVELQRLQNDPHQEKLVYNGRGQGTEEFVETEYYKDLDHIDKQHHTTGTGFIKMENVDGRSFSLVPDSVIGCHASCKGNPATNDWIPSANDKMAPASDKPNRSDN